MRDNPIQEFDNPIQTATRFDSHSDSEDDSQSTSVDHNSSFITRRKSSPQIPKEALGCDYSNNKMTINAKPRKKLWLRIMVFLVFFLCLAVFLVPKERLFGLDLEGELFDADISNSISDSDNQTDKDTTSTPLKTSHCKKPYPGRPLIQYALMIDAGSTGSRIHVYRFNYCKNSPQLEDEVFHHVEPGLSSYPDNPEGAAESLDELVAVALKHVPAELHSCTPVAVKATAGLRLLGVKKSLHILKAVRKRLENKYPFPIIENEGVAIMDGKDEGVYAWITVNYLLQRIGSAHKQPTAAIFDLGGGSTQIVFEPDSTDDFVVAPGEHRYELQYGGHTYVLYQHSYLGYGLMSARRRIKEIMIKMWHSIKSKKVLGVKAEEIDDTTPHPCLPKNYTEELSLKDILPTLDDSTTVVGTGAGHAQCRAVTEHLFDKNKECSLSPCAFDGVYQPPLRETFSINDIYAFSYFYDRANPLGMPSEFSLGELRELTDAVCAGDVSKFAHLPEAMKELQKNPHYCMDLTFIYGLLHFGYEIPLDREVKIAKKIKGIETGWCLGAAIAVLDSTLWCKA
ncbi:6953_t:CDS:2 [Paraglomus brasilianum]|uniref:guanosine-diphosphatase n=1 Tax=Paraglomus brasilianum TaxID=144538 RepID=A0A9N8W236_9GLOM|nr:6953_t:CDS:2 [Paraglomus brasilianum]